MKTEKHKKTYSVTTFGCQMNVSDSERVEAVCKSMGYERQDDPTENSDVYIINTCSIRQKAEDRVLGMGKKFNKIKSINPNTKVILTGCMVKRDLRAGENRSNIYQDKYIKKLFRQMPWLDHIVEINDIYKLPDLLEEDVEEKVEDYFAVKPHYNSNFQAFVPISTGCNKFCTFCIVPFTRGKEIYRPFEQIYHEVKYLVENGYKEITLLGQNVNSWKQEIHGKQADFAVLMEELAKIEGEYWLRFTSSHPYDINPYLMKVIAKEEHIAKQVHFAMQSGSDTVLKRMNRHYTINEFKKKVQMIRDTVDGVGVTTDVIVGFCEETEQEFQETAEVMKELQYEMAYISEYSQRDATIASKFYQDTATLHTKATRKKVLEKILLDGVTKNNNNYIGTTQKILIYKDKSKNKKGIFGRTSSGKEVLIKADMKIKNKQNPSKVALGNFINVKITGYKKFCLEGEPV